MPIAYRDQITKTFRDNAIRSVLLIDDEYFPYPELSSSQISLLNEMKKISNVAQAAENPTDDERKDRLLAQMAEQLAHIQKLADDFTLRFKRTTVAEQFVRFFHDQECICDVEKQTQNLNPDKVRKSDLIILDYCLTGDDATKSLQLLRDLSRSRHLNLVVVYTNQPLERVWLEIAAMLRSPRTIPPKDYLDEACFKIWEEAEDVYRDSWTQLSREQQIRFILGSESLVVNDVKDQFWSDVQEHEDFDSNIHCEPTEKIVEYLAELDVRKANILPEAQTAAQVHGKDKLWIQCGEVFIALCEKKGETEVEIALQPEAVWDRLNEALLDWYPSFYRIVLSELQNRIEDSNFSMSKTLGKTEHEQIALLWAILKEKPENQLSVSESMLRYLLDDISDDLLRRDDGAISKFIKQVATNVSTEMPAYVEWKKKAQQQYNEFSKAIIEISKRNYRDTSEAFNLVFCQNVVHAYNKLVSITSGLPRHITTGTVLVSEDRKRWYVCVTPSCDTVPEQENDEYTQALSPHRLLTFVKLIKEECLSEALKFAAQSSHIFIQDREEKLALRAVNQFSKQPVLAKFIVKDHKSPMTDVGKEVICFTANRKKGSNGELIQKPSTLIPIAQLKPAYAARFQAIQSHHEGRIGVDYTPADFSEPEAEE